MAAALFVDLNNVYYCVGKKFQGRRVDYKLYLDQANTLVPISRAFAYGFQNGDEATDFITCMRKLGYETKYKHPRTISAKNDIKRMDWNVGICVDIFRMHLHLDTIIIGSSDPELVPLVHWIQDRGIQVIIFSAVISKELRDAANRFYEIEDNIVGGATDESYVPG